MMSDLGSLGPASTGHEVKDSEQPGALKTPELREDGLDVQDGGISETGSAKSVLLDPAEHTEQASEAPSTASALQAAVEDNTPVDPPSTLPLDDADKDDAKRAMEESQSPSETAPLEVSRDSLDIRGDASDQPKLHGLQEAPAAASATIKLEEEHVEPTSTDALQDPQSFQSVDTQADYVDAILPDAGQRAEIATSTTPDKTLASEPTIIFGVVLVGFNHALGPVVEYCYPSHLAEDEDIAKALPFLALPDGAHLRDEDYSCFHLYLPQISASTIYGISCIRQLRADELLHRTADVTRSTVQKGVVVLANKPIFGPIRDKLGVITRAFFAQRDFAQTEILEHFYKSLEHAVKDQEQTDENAIHMGMSIREVVWKFRMQTLTLFKLLLLQKRVMFFGTQVERLCTFQYALVSMVPLLLMHLEDAASPELDSRSELMTKATSLRSSDRRSLLSYLGLPLHLFGKGAFFQPYLPLQQMDLLQSDSYLVGATNTIFQSQRDCKLDVVVNLDSATIDFLNPKVGTLVSLTAADRKWMDEIVRVVEASWNPADPHRPLDMGYKASDDWLRVKFEEYVTSALSSIKFVDFLTRNQDMSILINPNDPSGLGSFNESWLAAFKDTPAYNLWNKNTDPVIFDLVEPKHPCEGQAHIIEDVGIRLVNGLHDLHLDERLGPTQEAISKGIASGSEGVWKLVSNVKNDLAKRQAEFRERREREEAEAGAARTGTEKVTETEEKRQQLLSDHVLAGAAEVGGRAASLATNFGSFLGNRFGKPRNITPEATPAVPDDPLNTTEAWRSAPETAAPAALTPPLESATSPRPRLSFLSSFRSPSTAPISSITPTSPSRQIQTSTAERPSAGTSVPTPSVSGFASFFRRASSTAPPAKSSESLDDFDDLPELYRPRDVTQVRTSEVPPPSSEALQDEITGTSGAWAEVQVPSDQEKLGQQRRADARLSTSSNRSNASAMSDVKL